MISSRRDLWLIPVLIVLAHVVVLRGYGWFRDEFYYLACAAHPDYGYVDHPALSIVPLWLVRTFVGDSLVALRLMAAATLGLTIWTIGQLTDELGGGRFARVLAMTCGAIAPVYLALGSFYSMNAFDLLFWALAAWLLLRAMKTSSLGPWIALGVVLGLGLENKISMLWLVGGLGLGVLVADPKRLLSRGPWVAGASAAVLFAPYVIWQARHDWATLEFMRGVSSGKMLAQSPVAFLVAQITNMHPATLPVWIMGLWYLLVPPPGRWARPLGVAFLAVLALLALNTTSRSSYLAPAFAPLFAAGACWWEPRIGRLSRWTRPAVIAVLVLLGLAIAPLAMPMLPVTTYLHYAAALRQSPQTDERKALSDLPQFYADRFGWTEWAAAVTRTYQSLASDEQRAAVIFASNYGEAGAIDVLGRPFELPPAVSGHNNYWLWGPGANRGDVLIALVPASGRARLEQSFESVEQTGTITCDHCMPYENHRPIFVCRRPRQSFAAFWANVKHFE